MNKELIEKIIAYNYNEYGSEFGDALVDLKHENEWLHHIIKEAREYHDNCINNLLDLDKIDDNERLAYKVSYEIHENYSKILGSEKE